MCCDSNGTSRSLSCGSLVVGGTFSMGAPQSSECEPSSSIATASSSRKRRGELPHHARQFPSGPAPTGPGPLPFGGMATLPSCGFLTNRRQPNRCRVVDLSCQKGARLPTWDYY